MEYLNRDELVRLFKVARQRNPLHHVAMLVGLLHGLRVSETLAIRACDICDGRLAVRRLKKSRATLHTLRIDSDPLFDESPLLELAKASPETELFSWSRQYMDVLIKRYAGLAGIHPAKRHYHVLKHSICVLLWQETHESYAMRVPTTPASCFDERIEDAHRILPARWPGAAEMTAVVRGSGWQNCFSKTSGFEDTPAMVRQSPIPSAVLAVQFPAPEFWVQSWVQQKGLFGSKMGVKLRQINESLNGS
jgi:hypothetical protein